MFVRFNAAFFAFPLRQGERIKLRASDLAETRCAKNNPSLSSSPPGKGEATGGTWRIPFA